MAEFEITHPDILSPTNKLDDKIYAKKHNFSGQLPLENLPDAIQSIVDQLGGKILLGYELVEEKNLPAGTTTYTFDGLDGDVDDEYLIEFNITSTITKNDKVFGILPNGITTNLVTNIFRVWEGGTGRMSVNTLLGVINHGNVGQTLYQSGEMKLFAKTGKPRGGYSHVVSLSPSDTMNGMSSFRWNDSVTKITNLVFLHEGGSFSGTVRLWKKIQLE